MEKEKIRLDKYLWAIRIFKTRALASEACDKNKVRFNGNPAKASKQVHVGDEFDIRAESRKWIIRVTGLLSNRVQFSEAIKYYLDITPQEENAAVNVQASAFHTGKRLSKIGRPTKKQKRELDTFFEQDDEKE
ncbi:MAG: RNA-binding S4 domain-containing protein [Chitinophagaceae bacterium]|nr:MAG: RNA-binding S4 domain-containing protein [Chitinophagaceae bacterium]